MQESDEVPKHAAASLPSWRAALPALLALALPVIVGSVWMTLAGAPSHYALANLACLVIAAAWIVYGRAPASQHGSVALLAILLALLLLPLLTGPTVLSITQDPVARWLPLGPFAVHSGMLCAPALAVLAARDTRYGALVLLAATGAVLLQPDAASGFALTLAAVGIHHVTKDWKVGVAAIVCFIATLRMAVTGEIAPQPFVERVLVDAASFSPFMAIALALGLAGSFALILFATRQDRATRFALAGALFGFILMAMMTSYPMPLLGYGAAPILGYGFALGLAATQKQDDPA